MTRTPKRLTPCPHCDGEGQWIEVEPVGDGTVSNLVDCPHCDGTGVRWARSEAAS